jgi:hypothetical protein
VGWLTLADLMDVACLVAGRPLAMYSDDIVVALTDAERPSSMLLRLEARLKRRDPPGCSEAAEVEEISSIDSIDDSSDCSKLL